MDIFDWFVICNGALGVLGGTCICVGFGRAAWFIMAFIHGEEDIWEENGSRDDPVYSHGPNA
jgi:hypothetical protein